MKKIKTLDLFCGAGGFSTGFQMTGGYQVVGGIDFKEFMRDSFEKNHHNAKFIRYDIRKNVSNQVLEMGVDLVIGSPPCQGFSDARGTRYRLDEKNDLVLHYFKWIDKLKPMVAIIENVKGMTTIGKSWKTIEDPERRQDMDFMSFLASVADDIGYSFYYKILNSHYYGVPQTRERVFCVMTKKELGIKPSLPIPRDHEKIQSKILDSYLSNEKNKENNQFSYLTPIKKTTVKEAFFGLGKPNQYKNGILMGELEPFEKKKREKITKYQQLVFNSELIHNHIAQYANKETAEIINRIPEGMTYRSDRRGEKHIGVWDLFKENLKTQEREVLLEISKLRTRKYIKTKKGTYTEGYVPYSALKEKFPKNLLNELVKKGYLQFPIYCDINPDIVYSQNKYVIKELENKKKIDKEDTKILNKIKLFQNDEEYDVKRGGIPFYKLGIQWNTLERLKNLNLITTTEYKNDYDLTSKAGLRGKYSRLAYDSQSRTLMTAFTQINELVHPSEPRGLSLREGARLMSFPDSFLFYGSFSQISLQIGNAVAPLVAYYIGKHIKTYIFDKIN